jgi:hypothetical protein
LKIADFFSAGMTTADETDLIGLYSTVAISCVQGL